MIQYTFRAEIAGRPKANGLYPVELRVTQPRWRSKQTGTPLMVKVRLANILIEKKHWVKNCKDVPIGGGVSRSCPMWDVYNKQIKDIIYHGQRLAVEHPEISITDMRDLLAGKDVFKSPCFFQLAEKSMEENLGNWSVGYLEIKRVLLRDIYKYNDENPKLPLNHINLEFLKGFKKSIEGKKVSQNTVKIKLRRLRDFLTHFNEFYETEFDVSIFKKIKIKVESRKNAIYSPTRSEIVCIEQLKLERDTTLFHTRNFFLMQFYMGGKRVSDILKMKFGNFNTHTARDKEYLIFEHIIHKGSKQKEKKHYSVVYKDAQKILDYYKELNEKNNLKSDLVFQFFKTKIKDDPTEEELHYYIKTNTALLNKHLKTISNIINAKGKLSTHSARHALANELKNTGESMINIRDMLAHSNIKTTEEHYIEKSNLDTIIRASDKYFKGKDSELEI